MNYNKYKDYISKLLKNTPEFMIINENNEDYIILDRLVASLSDNAMTWLFKVYLEQKYNILKSDKFTFDMRNKYADLNLQVLNINGNLFFNSDGLTCILIELECSNQIVYNIESMDFNLI